MQAIKSASGDEAELFAEAGARMAGLMGAAVLDAPPAGDGETVAIRLSSAESHRIFLSGRNNARPYLSFDLEVLQLLAEAASERIRQIRERVKGIIWLNPEGQWGWGIGDSVMPLYSPVCDIVKECRTVGQLVQVVDQLVHSWWRRGR